MLTLAAPKWVSNTRFGPGGLTTAPGGWKDNVQDRAATTWVPELSLMEFSTPITRESSARPGLDGDSDRIERLRDRAMLLAQQGFIAAVLTGEPGVGKRRLARWIHGHTRRNQRPLVSVDAQSEHALDVIKTMMASISKREGIQPGNIVVENVQLASAHLAQALVEFLAGQGMEARCGVLMLSTESTSALRSLSLEHGHLLGRSASNAIEVPPLRDRSQDIPLLAKVFLNDAAHYYGREVRGLSDQAVARLQQYKFPGNARELRSMVEQALLRGTGDWVTIDDLPLPQASHELPTKAEVVIRMPGSSLREIELQAIKLALRLASGRLVRASELLGITRHALRRKLEKYGLNDLRARPPGSGNNAGNDDAFI